VKQLTILGFDPALLKELKELSKRERISLNQAALRLMRKGAGIVESREPPRVIGHALDRFFGTWTDEQARKFDEAVSWFETIDPEGWR
jgi:hypothetical protein